MTTHTDEPQEPVSSPDIYHGAWRYDHVVMPEREAWAAYREHWATWARAELTAARTRIAEVEAAYSALVKEAAGVSGQLLEANRQLKRDRTRIAEAEGEIEQLTQVAESVQCFIDDALEARAERDAAAATAEALREVLRSVEWAKLDGSRYSVCPCCGHFKAQRHYPDCALAAALATTATDSTGGETT